RQRLTGSSRTTPKPDCFWILRMYTGKHSILCGEEKNDRFHMRCLRALVRFLVLHPVSTVLRLFFNTACWRLYAPSRKRKPDKSHRCIGTDLKPQPKYCWLSCYSKSERHRLLHWPMRPCHRKES